MAASQTSMQELASGKKQSPVAVFSGFMDRLKPQMALALPKHMTADRMARLALTAFSSSAQLQNCDMKSIAAAIMTAGQLGLEPGVNGAGFLVPYGSTCTFVPGWKGLVDLVSRSGRGTVFTGVIFRDQDYTFTDGARRDLVIHNETDLDDPADITHAYAIGWVKDAAMPIIELWRVSKIEKHRDKYNKVGKKHYSYRDWEMYCRKVPLLQVLKYMPCSIEVANAIAINDAAEMGHGATIDGGIVIDMDDAPAGQGQQNHESQAQATSEKTGAPADDSYASSREAIKDCQDMEALLRLMNDMTPKAKKDLKAELEAKQAELKPKSGPVTYAAVLEKLNGAKDIDELDVAADLIKEVEDEIQQAELTDEYRKLRTKIGG